MIPDHGTAVSTPQAPRALPRPQRPALALTQLCGVGAGSVSGKARPLHVVGDLPADRVTPLEVPTAQHGRVQVVRGHQVLPQHVVVFLEAHHVTCGTGFSARGPPEALPATPLQVGPRDLVPQFQTQPSLPLHPNWGKEWSEPHHLCQCWAHTSVTAREQCQAGLGARGEDEGWASLPAQVSPSSHHPHPLQWSREATVPPPDTRISRHL